MLAVRSSLPRRGGDVEVVGAVAGQRCKDEPVGDFELPYAGA
jgi:hypothetical protein